MVVFADQKRWSKTMLRNLDTGFWYLLVKMVREFMHMTEHWIIAFVISVGLKMPKLSHTKLQILHWANLTWGMSHSANYSCILGGGGGSQVSMYVWSCIHLEIRDKKKRNGVTIEKDIHLMDTLFFYEPDWMFWECGWKMEFQERTTGANLQ